MKSKEERIELGKWAKALLENPNFNAIINGIIADAVSELTVAPVGSDRARDVHVRIIGANEVKGALRALVNDAAVARHSR